MSTSLSLLITSSENTRRVPLGSGTIRVGRDPSADILIADPSISRHQFSILPSPGNEAIVVEMSAKSRYQFIKNGSAALRLEVFPGEFFELGPYKFELQATVELPQAEPGILEADPGGPVDLLLADSIERLAPRWRATGNPTAPVLAVSPAASDSPRWLRVALPAAVLLVGGYLTYDFLQPPSQQQQQQDVGDQPDLLADVLPIECNGAQTCRSRATDLYQIGVKLGDSGSRDLVTLYKAAKQLRRAELALGKDTAALPDLPRRAQKARGALDVAFQDLWFRYRRAITEAKPQGQFEALRIILSLCREDRHAFCDGLERNYQRLQEQLAEDR